MSSAIQSCSICRAILLIGMSSLLAQGTALAVPVIDDTGQLNGWANERGKFDVIEVGDGGGFFAGMVDAGTSNYSNGLYEFGATTMSSGGVRLDPVSVSIVLAIDFDGTISGNFAGGSLQVRATVDNDELGIAAGDPLLSGSAIEAAAPNVGPYAVRILFDVDFVSPIFEFSGDYLTFGGAAGAASIVWGRDTPESPYLPWGRDWSIGGAFNYVFLETTIGVAEPGTLGLLSIGIAGFGLRRRRLSV